MTPRYFCSDFNLREANIVLHNVARIVDVREQKYTGKLGRDDQFGSNKPKQTRGGVETPNEK